MRMAMRRRQVRPDSNRVVVRRRMLRMVVGMGRMRVVVRVRVRVGQHRRGNARLPRHGVVRRWSPCRGLVWVVLRRLHWVSWRRLLYRWRLLRPHWVWST